MKYAVQYAYQGFDVKIVEDTPPIEYDEAVSLFYKHLDDFRYRLKEGDRPQLCIWEDVGEGEFPIYGKTLVDLDFRDSLKEHDGSFYKTIEQEILFPTPITNEDNLK